jgi:hypothetical protein
MRNSLGVRRYYFGEPDQQAVSGSRSLEHCTCGDMLIYRGHGYWVFLLPLLTLGVFVHAEKGLPVFAANKRLWVVAALASAGLVCTLWGLLANRGGAVQASIASPA